MKYIIKSYALNTNSDVFKATQSLQASSQFNDETVFHRFATVYAGYEGYCDDRAGYRVQTTVKCFHETEYDLVWKVKFWASHPEVLGAKPPEKSDLGLDNPPTEE